MRPFDLEAAKRGEPVCTLEGEKARIICFDHLGLLNNFPIIALVYSETLEAEFLYYYTCTGQRFKNIISPEDLAMVHNTETDLITHGFDNCDKLNNLLIQIIGELKEMEDAIWRMPF